MAEFVRVAPDGWEQGDDTETFTRVSPIGWEDSETDGDAAASNTSNTKRLLLGVG